MKNILLVHQSADLYGSDRVFLDVCRALISSGKFHLIVIIPSHGTLVNHLVDLNIEFYIGGTQKVKRATLTPSGIIKWFFNFRKSSDFIDKIIGNREISLVYSNTIAIFGGAYWAQKNNVPHLWHVHEIVGQPALLALIYPWVVRQLSNKVICNSDATRKWISGTVPRDDICTISNGTQDMRLESQPVAIVNPWKGFIRSGDIVVTLIGRISRIKGQDILVDAAIEISKTKKNIKYIIVGDCNIGQEVILSSLKLKVINNNLEDSFSFLGFLDDVRPCLLASHIVVVPSVEAESFGLVAAEAMSACLPVIASDIGGLSEVVTDGETGLLVSAGNSRELATKILQLAADEDLRNNLGCAGREKWEKLYSIDQQMNKIVHECENLIAQ